MAEKQTKDNNWLLKWWHNTKNTKKNWKKVKSSPFASLTLALKARQIIIGCLIPYLLYMTWNMVTKIRINGVMGFIQKVITIGIMSFVCYKIYRTIPQAKRQIEYYKKNPHTINYCPVDIKETVDEILTKVKDNKENLNKSKEEVKKNV